VIPSYGAQVRRFELHRRQRALVIDGLPECRCAGCTCLGVHGKKSRVGRYGHGPVVVGGSLSGTASADADTMASEQADAASTPTSTLASMLGVPPDPPASGPGEEASGCDAEAATTVPPQAGDSARTRHGSRPVRSSHRTEIITKAWQLLCGCHQHELARAWLASHPRQPLPRTIVPPNSTSKPTQATLMSVQSASKPPSADRRVASTDFEAEATDFEAEAIDRMVD